MAKTLFAWSPRPFLRGFVFGLFISYMVGVVVWRRYSGPSVFGEWAVPAGLVALMLSWLMLGGFKTEHPDPVAEYFREALGKRGIAMLTAIACLLAAVGVIGTILSYSYSRLEYSWWYLVLLAAVVAVPVIIVARDREYSKGVGHGGEAGGPPSHDDPCPPEEPHPGERDALGE
jgi:hypothetical protein